MKDSITIDPFTLVTFNIRNTTDRFEDRKDLLFRTIENAKADIVALQEVSFTFKNQVTFLNSKEEYEVLEMHNQRDRMVVIFLASFVVVLGFLFSFNV